MTEEIIINGVNVAECKYYDDETCCNNDVFTLSCQKADCLYKQLKRLEKENIQLVTKCSRLEKENEKIKKQYNCYACGNCKGKEDYINLAKHHKGLRKQFDEIVKRNNTLSLRIEELEKENEELKRTSIEIIFNIRKESYQYYKTLEEIREITENHKKCFYGCCVDCEYQQECNGDDCSKFHIDKIIKVLESEEE